MGAVFLAWWLMLIFMMRCFRLQVIHHMSNKERRIEAIKELLRIVRIGGKVLVYVWAMEQDGRRKGFE